METKEITVHGKNYLAVSDKHLGACKGCVVYEQDEIPCCDFTDQNDGHCNGVVFHHVDEVTPVVQSTPSINMRFDLDLSDVSLPEVFKLKGLRLSTLDEALAKGTDAFTISIKDVPQETLEVIAQALAVEFLRRHSKTF
jgi:hypothetical protein